MMAEAGTMYPRPPIVLIVTGHEWLSLSIESVFAARGYAVLRAFTGLQAARQLAVSVDLLIVDRDLRDTPGLKLCRNLHEQGMLGPATPTILISADPWARDERLAALRAGAWDVAALPWDSEELFLRLDAWVRAKLAGDTIREQGLVDPVTGFYNPQGVLRRIAELAAGAARHRRPLGVVVLAGDGGLPDGELPAPGTADERVTDVLRQVRRASDAIGRLPSGQFVVLAPDTGREGVITLARRLYAALQGPGSEVEPMLPVRLGCYAVGNFRDASIAPTELLMRAAAAADESDAGYGEAIRFYGRSQDN